jgi:hypothetical protein
MDKLADFIGRAGSILRDIFFYFIPSIPFVVLSVPIINHLGLLDLDYMKSNLLFFDQSILRETVVVIILYVIGRILGVLSFIVFGIYDLTIGKIPFPSMVEYKRTYDIVKDFNEYSLYVKALIQGGDVYNLFFERNTMIAATERSLGTGAFLIGIQLISTLFKMPNLLSPGLTYFYILITIGLSIIFYFMSVLTATELNIAEEAANKLD